MSAITYPIQWCALIAVLLPANAAAQTLEKVWNVDVAATGTFTPLGGSDTVGVGPAVSVAVTRDQLHGEHDSHGAGVVGMFMTTWAGAQPTVARRHETWFLVGARSHVWDDIGLIALQAVAGVKNVSVDDSSSHSGPSESHGVFGFGISFNVPPVGKRVLIRAVDLNWFASPGDTVSPHRFSIGFGVDVLLGHSPFSGE